MSKGLCWEWPFIVVFWGSPLIRVNAIPQSIIMNGYSRHNSSLIGPKNPAKFENDSILRNGRRIKTTQPNLMILVSFSSAEDVWSNDVNKYNTFSSQGTGNPPFRFFWDTRYSAGPLPLKRGRRGCENHLLSISNDGLPFTNINKHWIFTVVFFFEPPWKLILMVQIIRCTNNQFWIWKILKWNNRAKYRLAQLWSSLVVRQMHLYFITWHLPIFLTWASLHLFTEKEANCSNFQED